jgi:histidine ammonia-lyase
MNLILTPGKVTLSEFSQIYWKNPDVTLNQKSKSAVEKAARIVENWSEFGFQLNKPPFCSVT